MHGRSSTALSGYARNMRSAPTTGEALLWEQLRGKRLGVAFRRQHVIGRFVADFAAPGARLVIEVDGGYHGARDRADGRRDRQLAKLGYRTVRLADELVRSDMPAALAVIRAALGNT